MPCGTNHCVIVSWYGCQERQEQLIQIFVLEISNLYKYLTIYQQQGPLL